MCKASVCHGDSTTTGGKVFATASTMFDADRRIALDGEMATCGNCPGEHPTQGTGADMDENGRASVLDNDPVQCPCGKNYAKARSDAGFDELKSSGTSMPRFLTRAKLAHLARSV
jgi:uncharacterized Zn-binding protein involved in type VI secretion